MRYFAFFALSAVAMLDASFALVDARERTDDYICSIYFDSRNVDSECGPDGCIPELTRDGIVADWSRWSCTYELEDDTCEICFCFPEPQDIVLVRFAMYKGDERVRKIEMSFVESDGATSTVIFTSSGQSNWFESITVNADETHKLCMKPVDLDDDEWLDIVEIRFMVE